MIKIIERSPENDWKIDGYIIKKDRQRLSILFWY